MIELPTYTTAFRFERRMYAVFDLRLPVPVTYTQLGVGVATLLAALIVGPVVGVPFGAESVWFYAATPILAARAASVPLADGRAVHRWAAGQILYLVEPRVLCRLDTAEPRGGWRLDLRIWHPTPTAERSPTDGRLRRGGRGGWRRAVLGDHVGRQGGEAAGG